MIRTLLLWCFNLLPKKDKMLALTELTEGLHEPLRLDKVNQKMVCPVEGLIIDGVQYYQFVNPADMPEGRSIHYNHFRKELSMGIDRETLNKYFESMKSANNEKDVSKMGSLIYMLQDTINNCTPLEVLYNIAALVYFDKAEDISCFDGDYNIRKISLFKALPNQSFFLTRLLQKGLKSATEESVLDIEAYLKRSTVKLNAYKQMLSGMKET